MLEGILATKIQKIFLCTSRELHRVSLNYQRHIKIQQIANKQMSVKMQKRFQRWGKYFNKIAMF